MSNYGSYFHVSSSPNEEPEWTDTDDIRHQVNQLLQVTYYNYVMINLLLSALFSSFGNSL